MPEAHYDRIAVHNGITVLLARKCRHRGRPEENAARIDAKRPENVVDMPICTVVEYPWLLGVQFPIDKWPRLCPRLSRAYLRLVVRFPLISNQKLHFRA